MNVYSVGGGQCLLVLVKEFVRLCFGELTWGRTRQWDFGWFKDIDDDLVGVVESCEY